MKCRVIEHLYSAPSRNPLRDTLHWVTWC